MTKLQETFNAKCTKEECRFIAKKAQTKFRVLSNNRRIKKRAKLFQALGNETRLRIAGLLSMQEMCSCEIVEALNGSASTITHHLRMLEDAELIASRQVGKFTIYSLNNEPLTRHRIFD
jgi:DNA-binding transcriptional ArsR family regulator